MNDREQRPLAPRPDVTRGLLTPATKDLSALVTSGENPTVLAFVLGRRGDRVVYEVLNRPEPPTFVYRAAGADGMTAINRGLDDAGFRAAAAMAPALVGEVPHDARWRGRIAELLADQPPGQANGYGIRPPQMSLS